MKKTICLLSVFALAASAFAFASCGEKEEEFTLENKTVVIATSSLRGNVDKLSSLASLKASLTQAGASVLLVDTGNFLQGSVYTTYDSGATYLSLMKQAGYDAVTVGTHEFDFGTGKVGVDQHEVFYEDGTFGDLVKKSGLIALSANVTTESGEYAYTPCTSFTLENGKKVALVGVTDENTKNYVLESNLSALSFRLDGGAVDKLLSELDADYTVSLSNSVSFRYGGTVAADKTVVGVDEAGFALSVFAFDDKGNIKDLSYSLEDYEPVAELSAKVEEWKATVDSDESFSSRAALSFALNGSQKANRSEETNLGDLWTDAIRWYALHKTLTDGAGNEIALSVDADHVVSVWNGGNLRDYLNAGDVVMKDIKRVLPYPNKIAVVYFTGAELVEFLEAASQGLPYAEATDASLASFLQVSGLSYTVDTSAPYEKGEAYGKNWFKDNNVGARVSVSEVNGKAFDKDATYAVICSNAVANGMDANYLSATEGRVKAISSYAVTDAVFDYITQACDGVIDSQYASAQNRITVK